MSANRLCPQCGKAMPPDAPEGLCPACLLVLAATSLGNPPPPGPGSYAEPPETETKALPPGTRLGYVGDYELIEEIARGGMGVVYKARQTSLKRIVAVKMIRSGGLADETEVARFRAEAEAAANLKHPNIVAIHEIGEHEGRHYFSMDYVAGKNLAQFADGRPVPARQAAEWLKAIAEAVQFAHQRGVLHRDLKPQNILVDAEGRPHVTDFGLAKNLHADSGVTQTGAVMGSPSYMAPEQARGRNDLVGTASDVYSLGAVLYQLVTGRAPFLGDSPIETLQRVVNDEPTRPCSLNPDTPVDLETICLKCLEKDPTRRYPTARALAEDVGRFLAGEPILARPAGTVRNAMAWLKRHPGWLAGAAALFVFSLVCAVLYLYHENSFMRAQHLNPGLKRTRGGLTDVLFTLVSLGGLVVFNLGLWINAWFTKHARRTTWSGLFDQTKYRGTWPVPSSVRAGQALAGAFCTAYGFLVLALTIQVFVWEGATPLSNRPNSLFSTVLVVPLFAIWGGFWMLLQAWRDHVRATQGTPVRSVDEPTRSAIRQAVSEGDLAVAMKIFRQAVPGAGFGEARDFAYQFVEELKAKNPQSYQAAFLKPWWDIQFRPLAITALIEAALLVAGLLVFAPAEPLPVLWHLGGFAAFGIASMVSTRLRGFLPKFLPICAALLFTFLGDALVFDKPTSNLMLSMAIGFPAGVVLMQAGYAQRR